ncbi:uncharacterized protein LOC129194825 isoform X2 [Dunckerocampus dactyliophorus]|uniref:uncharacterized protein LOC129194825 isoform X2 n=1 Tax=Dunckerocampus dactyliophorus TaxID=161453 RepID=UPI0024063867|nr:uncharacterized protein LOC129194825 isoform X2 [Dunckerocampus dactyliophorus]
MATCTFNYFLYSGSGWLLLLAIHHEAQGCQSVFHKRVGDTVELPSCSAGQDLTFGHWNYQGRKVVMGSGQFAGRLHLNPHNFSLTLTGVTLHDMGVFSFVSAINDSQRETVHVRLHVHEPITTEPVVTVNATWNATNQSCSILLDCSAPAGKPVEFKWTVTNGSLSGARHHIHVLPQHATREVTCTIYNVVSEKSASVAVKCANDMSLHAATTEAPNFVFTLSVAAGACLLVMAGIVTSVACHHRRRRAGRKCEEMTVYADICDGRSTPTKESSPYESVGDDERTMAVGVSCAPSSVAPDGFACMQTLYDKIDLARVATQDHTF